jgi:hypothetical protein
VARDEPQVSVGGMLDMQSWKQFRSFDTVLGENPNYRKSVQRDCRNYLRSYEAAI